MTLIIIIFLVLCVLCTIIACNRLDKKYKKKKIEEDNKKIEEDNKKRMHINKMLLGNKKLKKFRITKTKDTVKQGYFFLFFGECEEFNINKTTVTFYWLNNNNEYIISELPLNRIRIKIDNNITEPYINFVVYDNIAYYNDNYIMRHIDEYISYAVVTCKDEDFPNDINLNTINKENK